MADGRGEIEVALVTDAGVERFRHMLGGGAFLAGSRAAKFAIAVLATFAASLASYQLLVRHTIVGTLLNGHRPRA